MDVRPNSITKVEKISQRTTLFSGDCNIIYFYLNKILGAVPRSGTAPYYKVFVLTTRKLR